MDAFRSAGVHRLELGAEVINNGKQAAAAEVRRPLAQSHGAVQQRVSFLERHRREQEELRAQGANALWPQRAISAENVGYSLLKKAGWREGTGLGAAEQGRVAPVQAWLQKGNRGVGFDHKAAQEKQAREQQRKGDEAAAKRRAEAAAQRVVGDERSRKLAKIVEDELKGEDIQTKLNRHQAVMRQEEEDAKRRSISRYLSRAFNDPFDRAYTGADSNPLKRKHRLTALNPLLDDDD